MCAEKYTPTLVKVETEERANEQVKEEGEERGKMKASERVERARVAKDAEKKRDDERTHMNF